MLCINSPKVSGYPIDTLKVLIIFIHQLYQMLFYNHFYTYFYTCQ